jgi:hypothetical protein
VEGRRTEGLAPDLVMSAGPRTVPWRAAAVVLLLCAIVFLVRWGDASSPDRADGASGAAANEPSTQTSTGAASSDPQTAAFRPARPVALSIPAIRVRTTLADLGQNPDGTVEVPTDPDLAGWYRLGTRPGAVGSAVILGHVDSVEGPAVFARLGTLRRGDLVDVRLADGSSETFRVQSVRVYDNDRFPARRVYSSGGSRSLNLVTCGGEYDAARGGYQANVVVHARWVHRRLG